MCEVLEQPRLSTCAGRAGRHRGADVTQAYPGAVLIDSLKRRWVQW